MVVLSLFDGISCGQIAFERLGIVFDGVKNKYLASEIKKIAIKTTQLHYPNTIQVGDVTELHYDADTNALYAGCKRYGNKYYNINLQISPPLITIHQHSNFIVLIILHTIMTIF